MMNEPCSLLSGLTCWASLPQRPPFLTCSPSGPYAHGSWIVRLFKFSGLCFLFLGWFFLLPAFAFLSYQCL